MKQTFFFFLICTMALELVSGCGRPEEDVKKLMQLQSELSQLHKDMCKKMTELSKLDRQLDELVARRDAWLKSNPKQRAKLGTDDINNAKLKIKPGFEAFNAWHLLPSVPAENYEKEIVKLTSHIEALKKANELIDTAIKEATGSFNRHSKALAGLQSSSGKKKK